MAAIGAANRVTAANIRSPLTRQHRGERAPYVHLCSIVSAGHLPRE